MGDSIFRTTPSIVELYLDKRAQTVQTIRIETTSDLVMWATMTSVLAKSQPTNNTYGNSGYREQGILQVQPYRLLSNLPILHSFCGC